MSCHLSIAAIVCLVLHVTPVNTWAQTPGGAERQSLQVVLPTQENGGTNGAHLSETTAPPQALAPLTPPEQETPSALNARAGQSAAAANARLSKQKSPGVVTANSGPTTGAKPGSKARVRLTDADRATLAATLASHRADATRAKAVLALSPPSGTDLETRVPRKMELSDLLGASATTPTLCPKPQRIEELRQKLAQSTNSAKSALGLSKSNPQTEEPSTDIDKLTLAAYLAGQGEWGEARDILADLERTSDDPAILFAVRRNLEVADKQLAVITENDPVKRSQRQLELGELHREFGHERVAKRILTEVRVQGATPEIRQRAAETLASKAQPTRPPIPPGFDERLKALSAEAKGKALQP